MQKSGIDVSIFQPHSTRSASTSTAFQQGVSVPDILKKADWSNASVFHRFYNRPKVHADFAQAILSVNEVSFEIYAFNTLSTRNKLCKIIANYTKVFLPAG